MRSQHKLCCRARHSDMATVGLLPEVMARPSMDQADCTAPENEAFAEHRQQVPTVVGKAAGTHGCCSTGTEGRAGRLQWFRLGTAGCT